MPSMIRQFFSENFKNLTNIRKFDHGDIVSVNCKPVKSP